jgi:hypothetical protein
MLRQALAASYCKVVNFCPEAWYLQRSGASRSAAANRVLK